MVHSESLPAGWVDIHCHILPELDDGPASWEHALAMARLAVKEGTAWIVATPHQRGRYAANTPFVIQSRCQELTRRLCEAQIPLHVWSAADVRIDEGLIEALKKGEVSTLGRGQYVLLELPHDIYIPLASLLGELKQLGVTGILTHPERNAALLRHPDKLDEIIASGGLVQITAGSVTGMFGPLVRRFAEELLLSGRVHVVASDGHGVRSRPPTLAEAAQQIARRLGREAADILCRRNPARIVRGLPVQCLERVGTTLSFWQRAWRRLAG